MDRTSLARHALRAAMQLRRNLMIPREAAVNAFDVAQMTGLDVRFIDAPSLEGMFVRDPGLRVLLPSLKHRPRARVLYSCAHEIGHHEFGHGTKADEYLGEGNGHRNSPEEILADAFARHLLMPRAAVLDAFGRRNWAAEHATPQQLYMVSAELGVGFETLLNHMTLTLELLMRADRERLENTQPKTLKAELVGRNGVKSLSVVDAFWKHVPIDAERGELVVLPLGIGCGCPLLTLQQDRVDASVYLASSVGTSSISLGSVSVPLRVARQHYVGPYINRYLDDPDEH